MKTETASTPDELGAASCSEFPWFATNEKQEVQIVKPRQVIMGNWLLCRNREGAEWFVPFPELSVNTPNAELTHPESKP